MFLFAFMTINYSIVILWLRLFSLNNNNHKNDDNHEKEHWFSFILFHELFPPVLYMMMTCSCGYLTCNRKENSILLGNNFIPFSLYYLPLRMLFVDVFRWTFTSISWEFPTQHFTSKFIILGFSFFTQSFVFFFLTDNEPHGTWCWTLTEENVELSHDLELDHVHIILCI